MTDGTIPDAGPPDPAQLDLVRAALSGLRRPYPDFDVWFETAVVPGLGSTRRIFLHHGSDRIDGIVIAKRTRTERKLCTVWVRPEARGRSVGPSLMLRAMAWLGTDRPLISVPGSRLAEFASFFGEMGFVETQRLPGRYRPDETEHVFNGTL